MKWKKTGPTTWCADAVVLNSRVRYTVVYSKAFGHWVLQHSPRLSDRLGYNLGFYHTIRHAKAVAARHFERTAPEYRILLK